jgi:hypothetical protein
MIQSNDVNLIGVYWFKIIARDALNDLVNDTVRFKVTLTCTSTGIKAIFDAKTITQVSFTIKQDVITIPSPKYETAPKGCTFEPILLSLNT